MTKTLSYRTPLSPDGCIAAITAQPWEYGDELTPLWYACGETGTGTLEVTFRGGKFRKAMKTRYRLTFKEDANGTTVALEFLGELLGLPPMTHLTDIELFLMQKIHAERI